jgi:uncharacterized phage protein gp47/JayE
MVVRTELTDVREGSVLYTLFATVAEQIAEADIRLAQIRDQFTFEGASGTDLDERMEEVGVTRLSATTATGTVRVSRTDTTEEITLDAGASFGRTDSEVTYVTSEDYTLGVGVSALDVMVTAQSIGSNGNAPSGTINTIVDADGLDAVSQASPLANGVDAESDASLRSRARRYLNSLARCQPSALEYQALSFTASDNTRASVATVYEDPVTFGKVELLIDDGNGIGALPVSQITEAGEGVSYYVNSTGTKTIGLERAVATAPTVVRKDLTQNPVPTVTMTEGTDYVVHYGRGTITLLNDTAVGQTVFVSDYLVYTGLVGELQSHIEGTAGDVTSGYRPAGISLRVLPAPVTKVSLDLLAVVADGANITTVTDSVESAVTSYLASLGAGEPAYIARIIDVAMDVDDMVNVTVYRPNSTTPASDFYPSTRNVLRAESIRAITSTTGA